MGSITGVHLSSCRGPRASHGRRATSSARSPAAVPATMTSGIQSGTFVPSLGIGSQADEKTQPKQNRGNQRYNRLVPHLVLLCRDLLTCAASPNTALGRLRPPPRANAPMRVRQRDRLPLPDGHLHGPHIDDLLAVVYVKPWQEKASTPRTIGAIPIRLVSFIVPRPLS